MFVDKNTLMAYEMIFYNGDFNKMSKTNSDLTWFEDIMIKHEVKWGQT